MVRPLGGLVPNGAAAAGEAAKSHAGRGDAGFRHLGLPVARRVGEQRGGLCQKSACAKETCRVHVGHGPPARISTPYRASDTRTSLKKHCWY